MTLCGRRAVVALGICVAPLGGCEHDAERSASSQARERWPAKVAYAAERKRATGLDIYVRSSRAPAKRLTTGATDEFSPSWAPGGRWLAYRVNPRRRDEGDIWVMRASGADKRNLTRSRGVADWSPAVSPDGSRIAFMSARGGAPELWLMNADGTEPRQLTKTGELSEYPSWSPDCTALAFNLVRAGNFEIARIALDGSAEANLTKHPGRDQWPSWSPDGRLIAFMSDRDGKEDVFVMRADGTRVRNLTKTRDMYETHPAWTPDGRLSYFQHSEGPVHVRIDSLRSGDSYRLPIDGTFVFDWAPSARRACRR